MIELVIRLLIFFAVIFGVAYGATHALRSSRLRRKELERGEAMDRIRALKAAYDAGDLEEPEYDELTMRIYVACREEGIDLGE